MRTVVAPTNEATLVETPRATRWSRYSPSVVQAMSNLMSPWRSIISFFIASLSGPIDQPSPNTSSVTPWRMSLCERPSASSDSVAQLSMLMKPGATARPRGVDLALGPRIAQRTHRDDPVAADRHVADERRAAAAVVDRAAADDDVVRLRRVGIGPTRKATASHKMDAAKRNIDDSPPDGQDLWKQAGVYYNTRITSTRPLAWRPGPPIRPGRSETFGYLRLACVTMTLSIFRL